MFTTQTSMINVGCTIKRLDEDVAHQKVSFVILNITTFLPFNIFYQICSHAKFLIALNVYFILKRFKSFALQTMQSHPQEILILKRP